jgi:YggT family protein
MLYEIFDIVLNTAGALLVGGCLMRLWMQQRRITMHNPVGTFVMALTDWIVRPLRRLIPGFGGVDWASLVAAFVLSLLAALALDLAYMLTVGIVRAPDIEYLVLHALVYLASKALYLGQLVVLLVAALSWLNPFSPVLPILDALTAPLLRPIRRVLPSFGRVDLSPLVLFVLLQIGQIILGNLINRWPAGY